jgi:ribosomal protein L20
MDRRASGRHYRSVSINRINNRVRGMMLLMYSLSSNV